MIISENLLIHYDIRLSSLVLPYFCVVFLFLTLHSVLSVSYRQQERGQLDVLKQDLGTYAVPANLKWRWNEENQGTTLDKNWTDIVDSHSVQALAG